MLNKIIRFFNQKKGYGLDLSSFKIEPEDFIFGDGQLEDRFGSDDVLRPLGQWDDALPKDEIQTINGVETWNCPNFGTENALQILMKAKYGESYEWTERYHSVLIGIQKGRGGSPHLAAQSIKNNGMLDYSLLPYDTVQSFDEFNSPRPMTTALISEGRKWLDAWEYGHSWVNNFSHNNIKEALKHSPLGVGVYAWSYDNNKGVYVKPSWATDNHWVCIFGYVEGKYWKVYDHYAGHEETDNGVIKLLDWNYPFAFMKRYILAKKQIDENEEGRILYNRFKDKHIIVPEDGGAIYFIGDSIDFEGWWTNSDWLQGGINKFLREQERLGNFTGLTKANFDLLTRYATTIGVKVEESSKNIINQLKAKL